MAKSKAIASRRIVVDASVVRGASATDGGPPAGKACRDMLQAILRICHRAVVSPALAREYDQHASRFGRQWRVAMTKRGKIVPTPAAQTHRSRGWLQAAGRSPKERDAMTKDVHLVLAAWEQEAAIVSGDTTVADLFRDIADLARFDWAEADAAGVLDWLEAGAPGGKYRLGSRPSRS